MALSAAAVFSAFSYVRARFQYAAARQPKAPTRDRKMRKKVIFVRREQMRKIKQTSPARQITSISLFSILRAC